MEKRADDEKDVHVVYDITHRKWKLPSGCS